MSHNIPTKKKEYVQIYLIYNKSTVNVDKFLVFI